MNHESRITNYGWRRIRFFRHSVIRNPCSVIRNLPQRGGNGFTLLETVVALTVILAAVVGPVSLITRGLFSFSFSKNKVIAANLAQEGIELIRLVRENNVACDSVNGARVHRWDSDPEGGRIGRSTVGVDAGDFVSIQQGAQNPCGDVTIRSPRLPVSCSSPLRLETDPLLESYGTYNYSSGIETVFFRCVKIISEQDDFDPDIPAADQMDVISTVTWDERGIERNIVLRERMYNWR